MQAKENFTYLITTSILDSFNWFQNCPPSWRVKAYASLVSSLRREAYKPHNTAQRGVNFEDAVYAKSRTIKNEEGTPLFQGVVDRVKGGRFQQVIKKEIEIDGKRVLLYGKADVSFPNKIVDIKTTEVFRGDDKYLNGWQHILYTYMTGIKDFTYMVAIFEEFPSNVMKDVYEIPYHIDDPETLLVNIIGGIDKFFNWLHEEGLFHDYEMIFSKNRGR